VHRGPHKRQTPAIQRWVPEEAVVEIRQQVERVPLGKDGQVDRVTPFNHTHRAAEVELAARVEMVHRPLRRTPVQSVVPVVWVSHPAFRERRRTTAVVAAAVCMAQAVRADPAVRPVQADRVAVARVP